MVSSRKSIVICMWNDNNLMSMYARVIISIDVLAKMGVMRGIDRVNPCLVGKVRNQEIR